MAMLDTKFTFSHKGLDCTIVERPDLLYCLKVHGFRKSNQTHWLPKMLFGKDLSFNRVKELVISMIDGVFIGEGRVEQYGDYYIYEDYI
jgi:hypothetical protein